LTVNRETLAQELVFHLVEYDVPYGFYPHQIQFRMVLGARALDLSDQWHPPGEKVRLAAALPGDPWGRVLDDGQEALRWGPPLPEPPFPILSGEEE
jgi:hypothetical protein